MLLEIKTTALGRLPGSGICFGNADVMTLAPGQVTLGGSLVLVGDPPELAKVGSSVTAEPKGSIEVTLGQRRPTGIDLTVRAISPARVTISHEKAPIGVVTVGHHQSHLGPQATDLLAEVSDGSDARKIVAIQKILQKPGRSIIDQKFGPYGSSQLACGSVVQSAGEQLFGRVDHSGRSYHVPLKAGASRLTREDVRYDPKVTSSAIAAIKALLDKSIAVRVGVFYKVEAGMVGANGALQAERSGGHTVLIVGYCDTTFLYLDPYAGGSRLRYRGGLAVNRGMICEHLGVFSLSSERGDHLEVSDVSLDPDFGRMEVISGPLPR